MSKFTDVELVLIAHCELSYNDTIEVYDFEDGAENNRRPANPYLRLQQSFDRLELRLEDRFGALRHIFHSRWIDVSTAAGHSVTQVG